MRNVCLAALSVALVAASGVAEARWLSVDPVTANASTGQNFNRYYYANNNPYKYIDPDGRATVVVVNNNDRFTGTHSGLVVLRGDKATIYDPAGSFQNQTRGTGGIIEGPRSDFQSYVRYQFQDGNNVKLFVFPTTPEQEAQIIANAEDQGDPRGFSCTTSVTSVLQDIAQFKDLKVTMLPSNLMEQMKNNKNQVPQPPPPPPDPEKPKPEPDRKGSQ